MRIVVRIKYFNHYTTMFILMIQKINHHKIVFLKLLLLLTYFASVVTEILEVGQFKMTNMYKKFNLWKFINKALRSYSLLVYLPRAVSFFFILNFLLIVRLFKSHQTNSNKKKKEKSMLQIEGKLAFVITYIKDRRPIPRI